MRPERQPGGTHGLTAPGAGGPAALDEDDAPRPSPQARQAQQAAAAAGDSITVAAWTIVSRVTGVARFACIGAVLGPTFFGNTYQFTNSLPNLVYYGFLAGSLFSSLLVPALVRHIDARDRRASERVAGGFLGMTLVALVLIAPVAIFLGPLVLRFAALGVASHVVGAAQARVGQLLIIMFIPQIFFYGVVGTATAVMNSRQRFALAAAAPAVENLGTIAVLLLTATLYGTGTGLTSVSRGEMLLLGLGSTGAVALHATTQWWGAHRAGVVLLPRPGWRDPEVRVIIRRALPSLAQAGLVAFQVLTLLVVANRLPGGVVAFQIALNFYYLAIAIGATPVALSLLPRLARMHLDGDEIGFRDTLVRGLALGFFITIPAAVGYLALALPLARAISFGRMSGASGVTMVAASLAALSVAVVGQTAFMIATYASYAKKDTRSPLISMLLQAAVCLALVSTALLARGWSVLVILGLSLSAAVTIAACHLTARLFRGLPRQGSQRLTPSLAKFLGGAVVMAGPAWLVADEIPRLLGRPFGPRLGIVVTALVGSVVYLALQAWWRTPEFGWLAGGIAHLRARASGGTGQAADLAVTDGMTGVADVIPRRLPRRTERAVPPSSALVSAGGRLRRRPASYRLAVPVLLGAVALGTMCALRPLLTLAGVGVAAVIAGVWARPALAAYLVILVTPLTVGISRGAAIPVLRPNEALAFLVGGTLAARALVNMRTGQWPRFRLGRVEVAIIVMAVANSVVPLLWMTIRRQQITRDDLEYALVLWKFLGLYAIVRSAVITDRQIRRCLWLSVTAACVVALLAILQARGLFGVPGLLERFYQTGVVTGLQSTRGASTLGLPAATADLCILNLAIVVGLWIRIGRWRPVLAGAAGLLVLGALSAGEFSSAIGLVVGLACIAIVTRKPRLLAIFVPAGLAAGVVLWPVISARLSGFHSASGLPVSWTTRLQNLQTYFWPTLFSHGNFILGVRPAARILDPTQVAGYVWIESGYTWLLWGGGIPLLAGFVYFVYAVARRGWLAARGGSGAKSVAGIAIFAMIFVLTVLMTFDPHLTYRGSGDDFIFLLALAAPWPSRSPAPGAPRAATALPVRWVGSPGGPGEARVPLAVPGAGRPVGAVRGHDALVLAGPVDGQQLIQAASRTGRVG
jgi:putative peptidoglycan lipid II flippase